MLLSEKPMPTPAPRGSFSASSPYECTSFPLQANVPVPIEEQFRGFVVESPRQNVMGGFSRQWRRSCKKCGGRIKPGPVFCWDCGWDFKLWLLALDWKVRSFERVVLR